jgi:hypothetical protein
MGLLKALAVGMFLIGLGISYIEWNSGEHGLHAFVWPFALGGTMYAMALLFGLLFPELAKEPGPFQFPKRKAAPPPARLPAAADLGPELFRCRPVPLVAYLSGQGFSMSFVVVPFVALPALAAIAAVMVPVALSIATSLSGHSVDALQQSGWWQPLIGASFVAAYATGIWLLYLAPLRDRLVLHGGGFRLRCNYKSVALRFNDLLEINFGRELKDTPEGAAREVAREGMFILNSAMNLQLKSGGTVTVKTVLRRFVAEDLEKFLDYVEEHHPALFVERAYLKETPTGPGFVITESRWKTRQPDVPHPRTQPAAPFEQLQGLLPATIERSPLRFSANANPLAAGFIACVVIVCALSLAGEALAGDNEDDSWMALLVQLAIAGAIGYSGVAELRFRMKRLPAAKTVVVVAQPEPQGECPKCHGDVQSHQNLGHCVYCGSDQIDAASAPARCRACGSYLKTAAGGRFAGHVHFCGHCGFRLSAQA